jgi:hypothetical protein
MKARTIARKQACISSNSGLFLYLRAVGGSTSVEGIRRGFFFQVARQEIRVNGRFVTLIYQGNQDVAHIDTTRGGLF